jgi:ubiquinone/menaquinone biosynthesis C-methylase UbiE
MDEITRTLGVYESATDSYVEKYTAESVAELYGDPFFDAVEAAANATPRVLDIGCGPGPDTEVFSAAGHDVTGFDITASFLREGADRVPAATFVRGDMRSLPFETNSFDGIWASASFHHVPRSAATATLRDWRRVIRPSGHVFVSAKRDETLDGDTTDRFFEYYDAETFRSLLDNAGFEPATLQTDGKWVWAIATA